MKKFILTAAFLLALVPGASARQIVNLPAKASQNSVIFAGNSVSTGSTIYTATMDISDAAVYGLSYRINSTASTVSSNCTPNVLITVQASYSTPNTEETADTRFATFTTISSASTGGRWFNQTLTVVPVKFMRFVVQGSTANATDTTVQLIVSKQYDV